MGGNYDHQHSSLSEKLISSEKYVKEKAHLPILNQHKRDIIRPFFFLYITVSPLITMIRDAGVCPFLHYYIWAIIFTILSVMQCMSSVIFIIDRMKEKTPEDEKCTLEVKLLLPTGIIFLLWVSMGIYGVVLMSFTRSHPSQCDRMYADLTSQSITTVVIGVFVVLDIIWQKKFAGRVKDPFREAPPPTKKSREEAEDETTIDASLKEAKDDADADADAEV